MNKALLYFISLLLLMFVVLNFGCSSGGGGSTGSGGYHHPGDDDSSPHGDDDNNDNNDNNDNDDNDNNDNDNDNDDTAPPDDDDNNDNDDNDNNDNDNDDNDNDNDDNNDNNDNDDNDNDNDDNDDDTTGIYVSGSVLELWGIGIANENVCLNTACDSTDSNGNFTITVDASGNYAVTVTEQSGDTYVNMSGQTINVPSGGLSGLEFLLARQYSSDGSNTLADVVWATNILPYGGGGPGLGQLWESLYQHGASGMIYYNMNGLAQSFHQSVIDAIAGWQTQINNWSYGGNGYTLAQEVPGCDNCVKFLFGSPGEQIETEQTSPYQVYNATLYIDGAITSTGHECGHGYFNMADDYSGNVSVMNPSLGYPVNIQDGFAGYIAYMLNDANLWQAIYWSTHTSKGETIQDSLADETQREIADYYGLPLGVFAEINSEANHSEMQRFSLQHLDNLVDHRSLNQVPSMAELYRQVAEQQVRTFLGIPENEPFLFTITEERVN